MFLKVKHRLGLVNVLFGLVGLGSAFVGFSESQTRAFFGDTHIHTRYSFDAFMFNVRTGPDDAYRYAKGEVIDHPMGEDKRSAPGFSDGLRSRKISRSFCSANRTTGTLLWTSGRAELGSKKQSFVGDHSTAESSGGSESRVYGA